MFLMADVTVAFWYSQWRQSCRQPTDNMQFRLFSNIGPCIQQHYVLRNHWLCRHFAIPPMTTGLSSWLHYGQNIHGPKYVRIEGFRDHWPRCCLAIPPMATGLSSWLHYGQNIHGPKYVRTTSDWGLSWSLAALLSCDTANGDGAVILTALWTKHTWTEIRPYWGLSWSLAALLSCDTTNGDGAVILTALWTKHTWTEIRPYNVGLRAFVIIGRVAVLRYRQWRQSCHLDCIMRKLKVFKSIVISMRLVNDSRAWFVLTGVVEFQRPGVCHVWLTCHMENVCETLLDLAFMVAHGGLGTT